MRGYDRPQSTMLTLVNPEQRVPANHPIRLIKELAEVALRELSPLFEQMYSEVGRPSIPPERLLKASLLMALYTVRSGVACVQREISLMASATEDSGECADAAASATVPQTPPPWAPISIMRFEVYFSSPREYYFAPIQADIHCFDMLLSR